MSDIEPGGERTPARGRPSSFSPDVAQRIRELLGQGWSATSICHAIGIDRSTLFRWQQRDPDLCNPDTSPVPDTTVSDIAHRGAPAPPAPERDAADDQVVLVVRRPKAPAPPAPINTPFITAADRERARIAANHAPRPLGPVRDEPWRAYVGPDGVIAGGYGALW
jgi:Helix-turn-helix domain of resolvase